MSLQTEEYDISLFYETALKLVKEAGEVCYLNPTNNLHLFSLLCRLWKKLLSTGVN